MCSEHTVTREVDDMRGESMSYNINVWFGYVRAIWNACAAHVISACVMVINLIIFCLWGKGGL